MMTINKKIMTTLSILLLITITIVAIMNINQNKSTNVPKSATLVMNRLDDY